MATLQEWIDALRSDLAILAGYRSSAKTNGIDTFRRDSIRATEKRIEQAKKEIRKIKNG